MLSLLVTIINVFSKVAIKALVSSEKQSTLTIFELSVAQKLIFFYLFNSGFLMLITNILLEDVSEPEHAITKYNGLNDDIFYVLIITSLLMPILTYFNVFHLIRLF